MSKQKLIKQITKELLDMHIDEFVCAELVTNQCANHYEQLAVEAVMKLPYGGV